MNKHLPNEKTIEDLYADTENTWDYEDDEEGEFSGEKFNYHFVLGNEKIVFIKAGAGGSERGHEDKYIKLAERINERTGATVITASNPIDPICDAPDAQEILWVVNRMNFEHFELCFVGVSDGAYLNLELAKQFAETRKWIGINTSFTSVNELGAHLNALPNVTKLMIYGTKDDDFDEVVPELSKMSYDNFAMEFIEGADHSFTDMLEEFIALADYI